MAFSVILSFLFSCIMYGSECKIWITLLHTYTFVAYGVAKASKRQLKGPMSIRKLKWDKLWKNLRICLMFLKWFWKWFQVFKGIQKIFKLLILNLIAMGKSEANFKIRNYAAPRVHVCVECWGWPPLCGLDTFNIRTGWFMTLLPRLEQRAWNRESQEPHLFNESIVCLHRTAWTKCQCWLVAQI